MMVERLSLISALSQTKLTRLTAIQTHTNTRTSVRRRNQPRRRDLARLPRRCTCRPCEATQGGAIGVTGRDNSTALTFQLRPAHRDRALADTTSVFKLGCLSLAFIISILDVASKGSALRDAPCPPPSPSIWRVCRRLLAEVRVCCTSLGVALVRRRGVDSDIVD